MFKIVQNRKIDANIKMFPQKKKTKFKSHSIHKIDKI